MVQCGGAGVAEGHGRVRVTAGGRRAAGEEKSLGGGQAASLYVMCLVFLYTSRQAVLACCFRHDGPQRPQFLFWPCLAPLF